MKMADLIEVRIVITGDSKRYEVRIDGEPLPWYTNGVSWTPVRNGQPELTITIPAEAIDIEHRVE